MINNDMIRVSAAGNNVSGDHIQDDDLAREMVSEPGQGNVDVLNEAIEVCTVNDGRFSQVHRFLAIRVVDVDLLLV